MSVKKIPKRLKHQVDTQLFALILMYFVAARLLAQILALEEVSVRIVNVFAMMDSLVMIVLNLSDYFKEHRFNVNLKVYYVKTEKNCILMFKCVQY